MEHWILAFWAAHFPQLTLFLLILLVGDFAFLVIQERRRTKQEIARQARSCVEEILENIGGELQRTTIEARQAVARLKTLAQDELSQFEAKLAATKEEIEHKLADLKSAQEAAPVSSDLPWTSPDAMLRLAREAEDESQLPAHLAGIDICAAPSKTLESAGNLCRSHGFVTQALDFYREAAAKDPENRSARAEFLSLSAETRSSERTEALSQLQDLATQTLNQGDDGVIVQKRFFDTLTGLGRSPELAEFCETQLRESLPSASQAMLHRTLAVLYQRMGRNEEALAHCEAAQTILGDDLELLSLYGRLLFHAKKYEEAYRIAIRTLQTEPTSAKNYLMLAEIQEKRMGRSAARELLKKALQWADAREVCEIEGRLRRMSALDELSEILPSTRPQIIQA